MIRIYPDSLACSLALLSSVVALATCHGGEDSDSQATEDTAPVSPCGYDEPAMIYVPTGTFAMGSPAEEAGRAEDEEQHDVTLTHGYCVSQHEITQNLFRSYSGYNPSMFSECGDDCPVDGVSWNEAAWFSNVLSAARGYQQCYKCTGQGPGAVCWFDMSSPYNCTGYRLPTEAEWEYAARAGQQSSLPNGSNLIVGTEDECGGELLLDNGSVLDKVAWYCGNSEMLTHAVQSPDMAGNMLNLYDVSGNVSEWCHDWYSEVSIETTDPFGSMTGSWRVVRGGHYLSMPQDVRLAARDRASPDDSEATLGFRIVLPAQE